MPVRVRQRAVGLGRWHHGRLCCAEHNRPCLRAAASRMQPEPQWTVMGVKEAVGYNGILKIPKHPPHPPLDDGGSSSGGSRAH